jgi:3-oxoacyl-[acyl-carrier protein] reductase
VSVDENAGMSISLVGKWALVTGASRGIGIQLARGLAGLGCNLVLHSRAIAGTAAIAKELGAGTKVVALAAELEDQAHVDRLAAQATEASGGIDVLFNNAAIMTPYRTNFSEVSADDYRRSFEVNVIAPIRLTHALLPRMLKRRFGRIIQVTSGIKNEPELMAYAASKAALDKFVLDTLPKLRGTGVTMNLLDPGWLRTDLGGPRAPNPVESVLPGGLEPALVEDDVQGKLFCAQDYRQS